LPLNQRCSAALSVTRLFFSSLSISDFCANWTRRSASFAISFSHSSAPLATSEFGARVRRQLSPHYLQIEGQSYRTGRARRTVSR
jgi:hypothetical protein